MKLRVEPISILVVFIIGAFFGTLVEEDKDAIDLLPAEQQANKD